MKQKCFLLLFLTITSTMLFAQVSHQAALSLVLKEVVKENIQYVNVWKNNNLLTAGNKVEMHKSGGFNNPYAKSFVFFVDDMPFANWAHPCRYVFIDYYTGNIIVKNAKIYPDKWEQDFTIVHEIKHESIKTSSGSIGTTVKEKAAPNPHMYAVIISFYDWFRYYNDISAIYCTLNQNYGYPKENIFVHFDHDGAYIEHSRDLDGDDIDDDIDYAAIKTLVRKTFRNLAGDENTVSAIPKLGPEDQLFIFIDGHGNINSSGASYILGNYGPNIYDYELADYIKNINCSEIIVVMENCYSGGFVDNLSNTTNAACKNRVIHTATDDAHSSMPESYISGMDYDEFVFYWTAAVRGFFPGQYPWEINPSAPVYPFPYMNEFPASPTHPNINPDSNNDGVVQMEEAFSFADNYDSYSPTGYYKPYMTNWGSEYPVHYENIGFEEDLLTLKGISGKVVNSQTISGTYNVRKLSVEPGVTLAINGNTKFYAGNGPDIYINKNSTLTLNSGSHLSIFCEGNQTSFNILGNIHFGNNTLFSFTNGLLKYSGKITSGSNASISIQSTGRNTKVMEISKYMDLPSGISAINIENGRIVMMNGSSRLKTSNANTNVTLDNVRITSNDYTRNSHKGLYLYRTQNADISNCIIEDGYFGVYSYRYSSDPIISFISCDFNDCFYGIYSFRAGVNLSRCNFYGCNYGWKASYANKSCSVYDCEFSNCTSNAIYFQGYSPASLNVNYSFIHNNTNGIKMYSPLMLNIHCSVIKHSTDYGIYLTNNASINLSPSKGQSDISSNKYAIKANSGQYLYLHNGYNDLHYNSGGKAIIGNFTGISNSISAYHNKWNTSNLSPRKGIDYDLGGKTIIDYYPMRYYQNCNIPTPLGGFDIGSDEFDPTGEGLGVRKINTNNFKNKKLSKAVSQVYTLYENTENKQLIDLLLCELLNYPIKNANNNELWYLDLAYNMYRKNIGDINSEGNKYNYKKTIKLLDKLIIDSGKEVCGSQKYRKALLEINKAHFLHLSGKTELALKGLIKLLKLFDKDDLKQQIQEDICFISNENLLENRDITPEDFDAIIHACSCSGTGLKSASTNQSGKNETENFDINVIQEDETYSDILVFPNPISSESKIITNIGKNVIAELFIYDISGRIVKNFSLNEGENSISIPDNSLPAGIYQIIIYKNNYPANKTKIVILK